MRFPVKVHKHMLDTQEESSGEELDEMGRMMTSMEVNQVTRRRRPFLKKETWTSLSKEDQEVWDQISDEGKTRIIFNDPTSEMK